ncbi:MAG TPA: sensor histidine kinase [Chromatiaceae bacterium]|nr:sensor histidine kinase [Chromatiaceae bacterium]
MKPSPRLLALLLLWLLAGPLVATPPTVLTLPIASKLDLSDHLDFLLDPGGTWTIAQVATVQAPGFSPLPRQLPSPLGDPTSPGVVLWLRLTLERPPAGPDEAWLEVAPATLDDVRLFVPQPGGGFSERRSGQAWPWSEREVDYRQPLFRLQPEVEPTTYYLRLETRLPSRPVITLWPPLAFTEAAMAEARVWGLYFGVYALIALLHAFFWMWSQERTHYLFTLYVALNLLAALIAGGWLQQAQPDFWLPGLANAVMAALICLSLPVMQRFIFDYVGLLRGSAFWRRQVLGAANLVAVVGLLLVLGGFPDLALALAKPARGLLIGLSLLLALGLAWHGDERARSFLLAFGLYGLGLVVDLARTRGWLPPGLLSDQGLAIGALLQTLVLSLSIFSVHKRLRREKTLAEAQAAAERRLREEQEDFLSLVSHEVRTPLSIIAAAAHNLLLDPTLDAKGRARGEKIRRASDRLTRLMDDYLSTERLASADAPLRRAPLDLGRICNAAMDDLRDTPGPEMILEASPVPICTGDAGLLRLAIRNLLQNARRHSPPTEPVLIHLDVAEGGLRVRVRDAGAGVPEEVLPLIFRRFRRGHNSTETGAGLGLYLVDKVARRHGGRAGVTNLATGGCEFSLWLPLEEPNP